MPPEGVDFDEWVERFFVLPTADRAEVAVLRALLRAGAVVEEMRAAYRVRDGRRWPVLRLP